MTGEEILRTSTHEVEKGAKLVEAGIKKAWSILDAATEKKAPSEYLSQKAVHAIQGKS